MTSQGTAHGRFTRAIQKGNLWAAESSLRELGTPSLEDALSYLALLAEVKPEKLERAAVRLARAARDGGDVPLARGVAARACRTREPLRRRVGVGT
jgi:hypothetical protein